MSKKILIGVVGLALIVASVGFALKARRSIDPIKARITDVLKNKTGREVKLDGELNLSIFPQFTLIANKVTIANEANFKGLPFLSIEKLTVEMALVSLLKREIKINRLVLDGLTLHLYRDRHGNANWHDLMQSAKTEESGGNSILTGILPNTWSAESATINDGKLFWDDAQTGKTLYINQIHWQTAGLEIGRTTKNELSMTVAGKSIATPGKIVASGLANADSQFERWQLTDHKIEFFGFQPDSSLNYLTATLALPELSIDLNRKIVGIPELGLHSREIDLIGKDIAIEEVATKPSLNGQFSVNSLNPKTAALKWGIAMPELSNASALTELAFNFDLQAEADTLKLEKLNGHLDKTSIHGSGCLKYTTQPRLDFDVHADHIALDDYLPKTNKINQAITDSRLTINIPSPSGKNVVESNINGTLHVESLRFNDIDASKVQIKLLSGNVATKPLPAR